MKLLLCGYCKDIRALDAVETTTCHCGKTAARYRDDRWHAVLVAREVQRGANLRISLPYYRVSAFFDKQESAGLSVVSDLQLYLDLYDYPLRGREQAEQLFERRLGPKLAAAERA